jgi:lipoprotein NlpD
MNRLALGAVLSLAACIPPPYQPDVAYRAPTGQAQLAVDPHALAEGTDTVATPGQDATAGTGRAAPVSPVTPIPVVPNAANVLAHSYVVQPGDTLRGIGNRTGAGSEIIALANGIAPPFVIHPGQRLRIPAGRYHLVEEGQTGLAIAQAYGTSWGEIVARNAISEPFVLRRGQRLLLPDSTTPKTLTPEQRAAAFKLDIEDAISGSAEPSEYSVAPPVAGSPASPLSAPLATPKATFSGTFLWPANGRIITRFGPSRNGGKSNGIDIAAPIGTPVHAAASGTVSFASDQVSVFGGLILIDHGAGWVSAYGYVRDLAVRVGQKVARGAPVAQVDDKGVGGEARLHFEIRKDRMPIDPLTKLPKR